MSVLAQTRARLRSSTSSIRSNSSGFRGAKHNCPSSMYTLNSTFADHDRVREPPEIERPFFQIRVADIERAAVFAKLRQSDLCSFEKKRVKKIQRPFKKKMSQVADSALWAKVKSKWHASSKGGARGQWNARKAQLAVKEYKQLGGTYTTARPSRTNSLVRWTNEDWGYIDGKRGNRYLPREVRARLSPTEKRTENRLKKSATKSGHQYASYSRSVAQKLKFRA